MSTMSTKLRSERARAEGRARELDRLKSLTGVSRWDQIHGRVAELLAPAVEVLPDGARFTGADGEEWRIRWCAEHGDLSLRGGMKVSATRRGEPVSLSGALYMWTRVVN